MQQRDAYYLIEPRLDLTNNLPWGCTPTKYKLGGGGCGADELARFERADRMAESKALRIFAAELIEFNGVRYRFHAFGDDLHPEIMGKCHDRARDDGPCPFPVLAHEWLMGRISASRRRVTSWAKRTPGQGQPAAKRSE